MSPSYDISTHSKLLEIEVDIARSNNDSLEFCLINPLHSESHPLMADTSSWNEMSDYSLPTTGALSTGSTVEAALGGESWSPEVVVVDQPRAVPWCAPPRDSEGT